MRKPVWIIAIILSLSVATKVYRLSEPTGFYFDENYHAFTAIRYLRGDPQAYNPWVTPPEPPRAYEWTHPPLAKLIMAGVMKIFGESSFGWRIGSVMFSTVAIAFAAALSFELFASPAIAVLTTYFMCLEGLVFAQSRIAMNDSYFICFMMMTFLFYQRSKRPTRSAFNLLLAGVSLGLALATKWTGLYVLGVLVVDQGILAAKARSVPGIRACSTLFCALLLIPTSVYLAAHIHFFMISGNDWHRFIQLQDQMWHYHTGLKATHDYESKPWQWILNLRPVWFYVSYESPGHIANIYNLGNSIILLPGLTAALIALAQYREQSSASRFALLAYFMMWIPWMLSPRVMFFYHYLPAVPFLCILLARAVIQSWNCGGQPGRWIAVAIVSLSLAWFIVFYPHLTGIPIDPEFARQVYFALPGWK